VNGPDFGERSGDVLNAYFGPFLVATLLYTFKLHYILLDRLMMTYASVVSILLYVSFSVLPNSSIWAHLDGNRVHEPNSREVSTATARAQ
jgi:hypothetical protein